MPLQRILPREPHPAPLIPTHVILTRAKISLTRVFLEMAIHLGLASIHPQAIGALKRCWFMGDLVTAQSGGRCADAVTVGAWIGPSGWFVSWDVVQGQGGVLPR